MANFIGVKIDTEKMTLEELEAAEKQARDLLANIKHQILLRKMAKHKFSNSESSPC